MNLRLTFAPLAVAALCAVGCDNKGSLGEYPESDSNGGSGSSETGDPTASSTDPTASESGSAESSSDTAGGQCGPDFCQVYEIDCSSGCGPLDAFDENGCLRPSCLNDPDSCGDGQRCYRPQDFGGCVGSGISCSDNVELEICECGGTADCGGAYCVAEVDYPAPAAGPDGNSRVEDSCAPNDGPAVEFFVGLEEQTCDALLPETGESLRIIIYDNPPQGTYQVGNEASDFMGQAFWDKGDGEGPHGNFAGTVTVTDWDESGGVDIDYELFFYEIAGGHLGGSYENIAYCEKMPQCG